MINYTTGDLLQSGAQALVNTVNTVGVMGKGIALHFKETFPHNFAVYADACRRGQLAPGRMLARQTRHSDVRLTPARAMMLDYDHKAEVGEYVHTRLSARQIEHIRQLLRLIDGYESAYALEVLASVAYVRSQEPGISLDDTLQRIEGWSQRKRDLFKREHIEAAYRHLDTMMA